MKYILSGNSGYCFGVKRAMDTAYELLDEKKQVTSLGSLIHNEKAMEDLHKKGLIIIDKINEINSEKSEDLIVRSHGEGPEVFRYAKKKNIKVHDLTCPFVKKIHEIVIEEKEKGRTIIIIGDCDHPEVIAINKWIEDQGVIFKNLYEIKENIKIISKVKISLVFQTTYNLDKANEIINYLEKTNKKNDLDIEIFNTICLETKNRQESAKETAKKVDLMIVIGGENSSNSKKLFDISRKITNSIFVQTYKDLKGVNFENYSIIGITAGASTPKYLIDEVIEYIKTI